MKDFLTTKQAAQRLGVSDARIRQMILEGVIKNAQKFGRENVITEAEIKRLEGSDRKPGRPSLKPSTENR